MKYQELYQDYRHLLDEELRICRQLDQLPNGYLTVKKISGKEYQYLQYTVNGKKKSEYIKAEQLHETQEQLAERARQTDRLSIVRAEQAKLEEAVRILDMSMSRLFFQLKHSAKMDALPLSQRKKALAFATAMTALEGLPAKAQTNAHLEQWMSGRASYMDYYMATLQAYWQPEVRS